LGARDDDTELDALAAHARSHPALPGEEAERLLDAAGKGDEQAQAALVQHSLGVVLDAAMARRDRGVEVSDLFQEGSMAAMIAVREYSERHGSGAQLNAYIRRVVEGHLDRVVEREEILAADAAAMVRDAQLLEAVETELRRRGGREPSETELAAALEWTPERVEMVAGMLYAAREIFDAEIAQYIDDSGGDEDGDEGETD